MKRVWDLIMAVFWLLAWTHLEVLKSITTQHSPTRHMPVYRSYMTSHGPQHMIYSEMPTQKTRVMLSSLLSLPSKTQILILRCLFHPLSPLNSYHYLPASSKLDHIHTHQLIQLPHSQQCGSSQSSSSPALQHSTQRSQTSPNLPTPPPHDLDTK
ncbi:hypothetical protein DL98DRAFT_239740 [Cadophora sp. DSE1049]|nr:hypothetical protein DL98DRAFT_239740 [Cadophora sp. DSE1049]